VSCNSFTFSTFHDKQRILQTPIKNPEESNLENDKAREWDPFFFFFSNDQETLPWPNAKETGRVTILNEIAHSLMTAFISELCSILLSFKALRLYKTRSFQSVALLNMLLRIYLLFIIDYMPLHKLRLLVFRRTIPFMFFCCTLTTSELTDLTILFSLTQFIMRTQTSLQTLNNPI